MQTETQHHEIDAWLGDDHGLTAGQIEALRQASDGINARWPGVDDGEEREAALIVAYRLMVEAPDSVVAELAGSRLRAQVAETRALAGLQQAAISLIERGGRGIRSQQGYAERARVDRMTVREWLGLRGAAGQDQGAAVGQTSVGTCPDGSVSEPPETPDDLGKRPDMSGTDVH